MKNIIGSLICMLMSANLFAAIPNKSFSTTPNKINKNEIFKSKKRSSKNSKKSKKSKKSNNKNIKTVKRALMLPLQNRLLVLKKKGPKAIGILMYLTKSESQPISIRWRSMTALSYLAPERIEPLLDNFLVSKKWHVRNAALISLYQIDKKKTLVWAEKLLNDPALVVRTEAIKVIRRLNATEKSPILWNKLYSKENYKRNKSLWVRRHIVATLAKFAQKGDEAKFVKILSDDDKRLHKFAVKGLERITKKSLGEKDGRISKKVTLWKNWWAKK